MTIMRVMPELVTPLWPQLLGLFNPALAMVSTHTAESVRLSLMAMRSQLWCQMDEDLVEAAATTEFVDYPVGMYVRVWLAGARKDCHFDDDGFFDVMNTFRENNQ